MMVKTVTLEVFYSYEFIYLLLKTKDISDEIKTKNRAFCY